jgi:hypothetical protein
VKSAATDATVEARIRELEAEREAARAEREAMSQESEVQADIDRQVNELVSTEGLKFATAREMKQFRIDLFETATTAGVADLRVAYELLTARKEKEAAAESRKRDALEKKRAQRVVSKPEAAAPAASSDAKFTSVDDAARAALDAMLAR